MGKSSVWKVWEVETMPVEFEHVLDFKELVGGREGNDYEALVR